MTPSITHTNSTTPTFHPKIPTMAIITSVALAALAIGALLIAPHSAALIHTFTAHPLALGLGLGVPALIPLVLGAIKWRDQSSFKPGVVNTEATAAPQRPKTQSPTNRTHEDSVAEHQKRQQAAGYDTQLSIERLYPSSATSPRTPPLQDPSREQPSADERLMTPEGRREARHKALHRLNP